MKTLLLAPAFALALTVTVMVAPAFAEESSGQSSTGQSSGRQSTDDPTIGTIVSSRPTSVIVRTDDGRYLVFVIDRNTTRPSSLATGARISVDSTARDDGEEGARTATRITLSTTTAAVGSAASTDPIPPRVRQLERDITRQIRNYRVGIRAGVALDPELVSVGVHATLGPIFSRRLLFRPNVEFAYGELTTEFAVNLEAIYRLSETMPRNQWSPYAGGGPTLGFSHRGFSASTDDGRSFDFSDFNFNGGLSILAGVEKPSGVFIELKSTVYTDPHLRLLFGWTF